MNKQNPQVKASKSLRREAVGRFGQQSNIANMPHTRKDAYNLLLRVEDHLKHSGQRGRQAFDNPLEAHQGLQKAIRKLANHWVRKQLTPRSELQKFRKAKSRSRRTLYKQKMQVFAKSTVPSMRTALPAIHGQGWLRRRVEVFPYGPVYTFNADHRVNVYRKGDRFDVIDALCNIPILAGLTRQGLKKAVQW